MFRHFPLTSPQYVRKDRLALNDCVQSQYAATWRRKCHAWATNRAGLAYGRLAVIADQNLVPRTVGDTNTSIVQSPPSPLPQCLILSP